MPKIKYKDINFNMRELTIIDQAQKIIEEYRKQNFTLTLRQLYYQFVSRDLFPDKWKDKETGSTNNLNSYKKLGIIISDARLSGKIDWDSIHDGTRELISPSHWEEPSEIIADAAGWYRVDKWQGQENIVEVWVEKDAIEGIAVRTCRALDIACFSCRGYTSQSSIWAAGRRLKSYAEEGRKPVILHLGDLDPSGVDMSRDIETKLKLFMGDYSADLTFKRIALNLPQVRQYNPPSNPAKTTDKRFAAFQEIYGDESWELDALSPAILDKLIRSEVIEWLDSDMYAEREAKENIERKLLKRVSDKWEEIVERIEGNDD